MEYKTVGLVFKTVENGRSGGHGINGLRKHIREGEEREGERREGGRRERGGDGREVERREMVVVKKKGARRVKCKRRARLSYADVSEEYYSARQPARYLPGGHCHRVYFIKFVTSS